MRSQRERVGCRSAGLWASALQPNTSVWQRVHVEFIGQRSLMLLLLKGAGQMSERLSPSIPPAWFRHIVKPFPDGTGDLSSRTFPSNTEKLRWGIPVCFKKYKPRNLSAVIWILSTHLFSFIFPRCLCFVYEDCFKGVCGSAFFKWRLCKVWTFFMVGGYASQKAMWINHSLRNLWVYATQVHVAQHDLP